ncbi:Putative peptidoglycan binding domain protein [Roseivivax jejudonensis]|uniref:Putative peptidoglycan binding domain protein n=1 Tax=Roseivivax jejudonensis TaxID=1529041 RepID=A0A1X6YTR9_9RHOB|nr:peptidoglycan-binding protein [Roseivivax jejudonensis]SLN30793.1 Putative peptidoglycan binding domain protein [Roseivivax jejudonensis]
MTGRLWTLAAALVFAGSMAAAQQAAFIQIEAQRSLSRAEDRVRDYASYLSDVNGFSLGGGWYGIALGPFPPEEAAARLRQLRAAGQIPGDSYVEEPNRYRQRFFPVGAGAVVPQSPDAPSEAQQGTGESSESAPEAPAPADETPREARASEAQLNRAEREELQIALEWAGHYQGPIDAAFGRGTRSAMSEWQSANGEEVTGILTTRQRAALIGQYNAVLEGLDLQVVEDREAGVRVAIPLGVVEKDAASSPFVRYEPTGDLPARVLLISQPGDRDTMNGLYEIMQTLEIVPEGGERSRRADGFTLTGQSGRIVSHTEARLTDGAVKGFTLIWPVGDEERRARVLDEMQQSFAPVPGRVLDPATVAEEEQAIDLVAGLRVRQPRATASGFYVDRSGAVVTALGAVEGCGRVTLDDSHEARVAAQDADLGAAVLVPVARLAPRQVAAFRMDPPRLKSEVAVSGYSFGGVLPAPTLTFGSLEDVRGLSGEENLKRLALAAEPGDAGGPVLDTGGGVLGMLLPRDAGGRQLPEQVSFAADAEALQSLVSEAGLSVGRADLGGELTPEDLTRRASDMTVLVSCWE